MTSCRCLHRPAHRGGGPWWCCVSTHAYPRAPPASVIGVSIRRDGDKTPNAAASRYQAEDVRPAGCNALRLVPLPTTPVPSGSAGTWRCQPQRVMDRPAGRLVDRWGQFLAYWTDLLLTICFISRKARSRGTLAMCRHECNVLLNRDQSVASQTMTDDRPQPALTQPPHPPVALPVRACFSPPVLYCRPWFACPGITQHLGPDHTAPPSPPPFLPACLPLPYVPHHLATTPTPAPCVSRGPYLPGTGFVLSFGAGPHYEVRYKPPEERERERERQEQEQQQEGAPRWQRQKGGSRARCERPCTSSVPRRALGFGEGGASDRVINPR